MPRRLTRISLTALAATLAVGVAPAAADTPAPDRATRGGEDAVRLLGDRTDEVARRANTTADELRRALRSDPLLRVDERLNPLFVEEQPPSEVQPEAQTRAAPYPGSRTFALHSRPAATKKVYLDFTGHVTAGTNWNWNWNNGNTMYSAPFDADGSPGTLSAGEHETIQRAWLRAREDFAPFDVDVTTEDPGVEGLRRTSLYDNAYGIRVVVTPSNFTNGYGGIAYIGSFNWASDTPAFVFTNGSKADKFIGEAASHEAGHTFGLYHDGTGTQTYFPGHADWAPIMGVGYYRPVTQWSRGEYAGATNGEDDLAKIAGMTGYVPDDLPATTATTATLLAGTPRYGMIERTNDADMFRFGFSGTRRLTISVVSPTIDGAANLNARLVLRNAAGTVIGGASPVTSLGAAMTVTLGGGLYYVSVLPSGNGLPLSTGYSSYASLGNYRVVLNWA